MRTAGDQPGPLAGGVVIGLCPLPWPWAGPGEVVPATSGQPFGTSLVSLVPDHDVDRLRMAHESTATRGRPHQPDMTLSSAPGDARHAEVSASVDATGAERGELIVRVRDITEQLRPVSELSAAVERLQRSNHELAEFARITAHDLSAPLLALSRLIDLISRHGEDPDRAATFDAIRAAIKRMCTMVDGASGYADSMDGAPAHEPVDLDELLHRVLETLSEQIADRDAVVTSGKLPTVRGDEHQLERVFLNLIANALKYSGMRPPRVRVEAQREPDAWRISVSDEGIGVREADRARIFELFARSANSAAGRGIGLATCRRIVELHGGHIGVESNDPRGSTFHFTLPAEPTAPGPA